MSTLQQLRQGVNHAWDTVLEGWQKLYRRAAGAITRFTPGKKSSKDLTATEEQDLMLRSSGWGVLAAEVFDDDDKVVVRLEAPGLERDDFDLQVIDGYLIVRGEKQIERERNEGQYHISECAYGCFERTVPLPDEVEADKTTAKYRRGVLHVELPKTETRRRKRLKVEVR
jgi:HSP20 family protein